ncbi:hypothetical protein BH09MYX1_BH09MYX1_37410 [soil metagenome]
MTQARFLAPVLFVAIAIASGCKDKETSGSAATIGSATSATSGSGALAAPAAKHADVPGDVCKLLSVAEVGAILGETVEAKPVPGGGCQFAGGTRKSLYPTFTVQEDVPGAGGIEGAKTGAQAVTAGTATSLSVGGVSGYVVTGQTMGATATQAAVAKSGLIVSVTMSGGEKANNEKIATQLLALILPKL